MNRKFNPVIAVGAVLLLAGVVVLAVLAGRGGGSSDKKVKALVAKTDIAAGTAAAKADLGVKEVPANQVPAGSPLDATALVGTFATGKIPAGQIITASSFGGVAAVTPAGISLHAGKQAIGVELSFAPGGLRYAVPGNKINVYVAVKPKDQGNGAISVGPTVLLLQDVLVLRTTPGAGDGNGTAVTPGAGNLDFLLEVDQAQAQKIISVSANPGVNVMYFTLSKTSQS